MSLNHLSPSDTHWRTATPPRLTNTSIFHLSSSSSFPTLNSVPPNNDDLIEVQHTEQHSPRDYNSCCDVSELMFEKPLTPSDVGKLNRLVIPKQHAERHLPPLRGAESALLSLEDESGKCWSFRYSYWSSSQSYVLTKGWSRFVKDKHLLPGDVVLFLRHKLDSHRLFIRWRRRVASAAGGSSPLATDGNGTSDGFYAVQQPYPGHNALGGPPPLHAPLLPRAGYAHPDINVMPTTNDSRRLRLFGVNLECRLDMDESEPIPPHHSCCRRHQENYSSNYDDCGHTEDYVNHMRDRRG